MKLGAARSRAPTAWRLVDIEMDKESSMFIYTINRQKLRRVRRREGRYLLRTNLTENDPALLWQYYIQLVAVEQAARRSAMTGSPGSARGHRKPAEFSRTTSCRPCRLRAQRRGLRLYAKACPVRAADRPSDGSTADALCQSESMAGASRPARLHRVRRHARSGARRHRRGSMSRNAAIS